MRRTVSSDDVEGVGARPRGVRRAVVERVEVVVDGLDLGPLHDGEAEPEEDVFEFAPGAAVSTCRRPTGCGGRAGQRHVDAVARQLAARAPGAASRSRAVARAAPRARGGPRWRPCRRRPRSCGGSSATPRSSCGSSALRPEPARPAAPRAARWRTPAEISCAACGPQLLDALDHDARTLDGLRVSSYSATVAAMAAFSESAGDRDPRRRSQALEHLRREPLALGADEQASAPARSAPGARAAASRAPELSASSSPGSSCSVLAAGQRHGEDRAHAGAHGLRSVWVRAAGAERDAAGPEGVGGADDRADVAGVAHAVQVDAQRPRGRRSSAARRRPITRVPEPSVEAPASSSPARPRGTRRRVVAPAPAGPVALPARR